MRVLGFEPFGSKVLHRLQWGGGKKTVFNQRKCIVFDNKFDKSMAMLIWGPSPEWSKVLHKLL